MFEYIVKYYNEFTDKEEIVHGIVHGEDYPDAVTHIIEYYGNDELCELKISETEEDHVYEFEDKNKSNFFEFNVKERVEKDVL